MSTLHLKLSFSEVVKCIFLFQSYPEQLPAGADAPLRAQLQVLVRHEADPGQGREGQLHRKARLHPRNCHQGFGG